MQNWVLDYNYEISALKLDKKRLMANIYENIHGIASLLFINYKLITAKRNVKNHPNIKRWENNILKKSTARREIFLGAALIEIGAKNKGRKEIVAGLAQAGLFRKFYGLSIFILSIIFKGDSITAMISFLNKLTGRYKLRPYFYGD